MKSLPVFLFPILLVSLLTNTKVMIIEDLQHLYQTYTGVAAETITELPSSGSNRRYFRLTGTQNLIGVYGTSIEENNAFLYMAAHFS